MKPRFQGIDNVYKTKADNKDIRDLLEKLVPEATKQMSSFAQQFRGATQEQTCRNIFNYIKNNFRYVADQEEQIIKLPSALLRKKVGDCKSYSLFTASILSNLGIPYHFVYASYNDNPIPHHVYVETENGCKIDVVYGIFNKEKKAKYKYKKNMNVRYMAGLGCTDCKSCNSGMGLTLVSKEKRQKAKEAVKSFASNVQDKAKDVLEDVKDTAKKAFEAGKKIVPVIAMGRGLFLILIKNNYDGIASKIALGDTSDLLSRWKKMGGNATSLTKAIKEGSQKPEKKLGFLPKLKKLVGNEPLNGVGIGKISAGLITAVVGLCTTVALLITPEKATGTTAGASFGSIMAELLPALGGVLAAIPLSQNADAPLTDVPKENPDDGEGDIPTSQKISKNLPLILGGLALLGAGYYFYKKKK